MSGLNLNIGDTLRLTSLKNYVCPQLEKGKSVGLISTSFTAPKGTVFVAVFMGVEPKDGSKPLDLEQVMDWMGWMRKPLPTDPKAKNK